MLDITTKLVSNVLNAEYMKYDLAMLKKLSCCQQLIYKFNSRDQIWGL